MPQFPRGARRPKPPPAALVLEVPLVSPQRRLHALRAFVKPHDWTREAVRHRIEADADGSVEQPWQPAFRAVALAAATVAAERLGVAVAVAEDDANARLRLAFDRDTAAELARAVGVVCSRRLPQTWWTLDALALLDGRFWRRERGRLLHLRPAADVHLPRDVRARVRDLL